MALHLERDGPTVTDIDHACVLLTGLDQNVWAGGGKFFQFFSGIFIRAVFAPHHGENPELGEVRFATEDFPDPVEFFRSETVPLHELGCNDRIGWRRFAAHLHPTLLKLAGLLNHPNSKSFE